MGTNRRSDTQNITSRTLLIMHQIPGHVHTIILDNLLFMPYAITLN